GVFQVLEHHGSWLRICLGQNRMSPNNIGSDSSCQGVVLDKVKEIDRLLSIAAVEREVGLSKDVLRVWERRYGFPVPHRDARGERSYPADQVARLALIKRLMDRGLRPGRLLALPLEELQMLSGSATDPGAASVAGGDGVQLD